MIAAPDRRLLAVPILGEQGGGVGQVSQLLWDAMQDEWPDRVDLVTLLRDGHARPHAVDKMRFGVALAGHQVIERPRCVVFSHVGLARIERYVPAALQRPYAVFLHGIEVWAPLGVRERAVLRGATLRIANSLFTARTADTANPGLGDIAICPLALPKGATTSVPSDRRGTSRTVLVVGRLASTERYKGHEQLIRAWPGVCARVPGAQLVIVGDGDDRPRLEALATEVGIGQTVRFAGFVTRAQLNAEYADAALFALPSRGEGFGLVYLEAMAHGLPCLGSGRDAAAEVIVEGETGVLVNPDDVAAIGRTISDLLLSPARRLGLGDAGQARVNRAFRYDRFRQEIAALLRDAFPTRPSAT